MILTEVIAKTKFCPMDMARAYPPMKCSGSDCMAWRVVDSGRGFCGASGYPLELGAHHKLFKEGEDAVNGKGQEDKISDD